MTNEGLAAEHEPRRFRKRWVLYGGPAIVLLVGIVGLMLWHPWQRSNAILPRNITAQITAFTPYQPELLPAGLQVDPASVKFDGGILAFRLTKSGASMTVTEQATPPGLADHTYPSEKIDGVDGTAYLSHDRTRTFTTLFANGQDGKPTMVLVNTDSPFTESDFKDLMRGFRAVRI